VPDDAPTAEFRDLLQEERSSLLTKLAELGAAGEGNGLTYDSNFADSSQVTAERSEAENLVASLRETLEEVERAIDKLDKGTYGLCEVCGQEIDPVRLEAMPAARRCINCASKH
jgi:DnaK suppressor protein